MMPICLSLMLWVTALGLQLVWGITAYRRAAAVRPEGPGALSLSGIVAIPSVLSLLLFIWVFVIGGSSNVAQFAAGSGLGLWRLWLHAFPLMLLGNGAALLLGLISLALPPYPSADHTSFLARVSGVAAAGSALLTVMGLAPDA